uniref:putative clathrin assembly protein At1g25240 n=1 Tax=Erigeron canadensis TaxID=72917 RepID=UPI001CB8C547|nr:putative clathrin assembly protein At1g25240 [Erigeron canadensis]
MQLWKRASGALKDHGSLLRASLTRRSSLSNPNIEIAVIKATTHDESHVDYRSAQRVFAWVRISDEFLYRVLWVLFNRMNRNRNWVVALKGLMLLHGVFCCKVPGIQEIGQLPYNLLNLKDKYVKHEKMSCLTTFIRAYFVFLGEKSGFIFFHSQEQRKREVLSPDKTHEEQNENMIKQDFIWLQNLQYLLDKSLEIQPKSTTVNVLVLEAMDCIVVEIYDIYSRISNGIGTILMKTYSAGKQEAKMALSILQKAKVQHEQLSNFFEYCKDIGVCNASECPKMEQIPDEVILELEHIISGDLSQSENKHYTKEEVKSIKVVEDSHTSIIGDKIHSSKTLNTEGWTVFEERKILDLIDLSSSAEANTRFGPLPDLISF